MPDPMTSETVPVYTTVVSALSTGNYAIATSASVIGRGQQAQQALITLESNNIRFHMCGLTPAVACGHVLVAGDALVLNGIDAIRKFKAVATDATTSTMVVTYFF